MRQRLLSLATPALLGVGGSTPRCEKPNKETQAPLSLSLLLISCAEYDVLSPLAFDFLKKNVIPYVNNLKVYYTCNEKASSEAENIPTGDLSSANFCARLLKALQTIPEEYVFLVQEDHWYITPTFDSPSWVTLMQVCRDHDLDQLKLHTLASIPDLPQLARNNDVLYQSRESSDMDDYDSLSGIRSGSRVSSGCEPALTVAWAGGCEYPISHHATIFRRTYLIDTLLETLNSGRSSPWEHEFYAFKDRESIKRRSGDDR
jgi:hypothetical protein